MESITVEVQIFASLREILGKKKISLQIKRGESIQEILALIVEKFETGKKFVEEIVKLDSPNEVREYVKFMKNGKILPSGKILDTMINNDGVVIAIFPPIGGG